MLLRYPIIISLILLLVASIGSAVGSKDKGKRKLDDTSLESHQSSSASQHTQHSGSPQQSKQDKLVHESTSHKVPRPFDLNVAPENDPEIISRWSEESISDSRPSTGHIAAVPSVDEVEKEDIETSLPLNQVTRTQAAELEYWKYQKQKDSIHLLNVELGVTDQNFAKWRTLEAYGQYILWLEKILLKNQDGIRNLLAVDKEKAQQPESLLQIQIQIQLFEVYIKNAEENVEYEKNFKKMFRVPQEEISTKLDKESEQKIRGISDQAKIKREKQLIHKKKDTWRKDFAKWILLLILPKLEMKKQQDLNTGLAIEWAMKYTKSLTEEYLKNYAHELANRPHFFENLRSTDLQAEGQYLIIRDMQPNEKLEQEEWDSFQEEVRREMGLLNPNKQVGNWLILDAYRRDILWLEALLLMQQQKICESLDIPEKRHLIPVLDIFIKSAETNRAYEYTPVSDIYKLTPEEIANDLATKRIHDVSDSVGESKKLYDVRIALSKQALFAILPKMFMKKMANIHIRTKAFEWARQYRKTLREDYLTPFENVWKPRHDFMPHILKQQNEKFGRASNSSTTGVKIGRK